MKPHITVEFWRGGRVESEHRVVAVVVGSMGEVVEAWGDEETFIYWRSSAKPFQAAAVVHSGAADHFGLTAREIALIAGSHSGEPIHTNTVLDILNKIGLSPQHLQCGIQMPIDPQEMVRLYREGQSPTALHNNCSGKHAGMLALATYRGFSPQGDNYLDPQSPVQQEIIKMISLVTDIPVSRLVLATDGCSAPVFGLPLRATAMAYARLLQNSSLDSDIEVSLTRVAVAMRTFPEMVAGTNKRICTELMRSGGAWELVVKSGAEGVMGAGWKDPHSGKAYGLAIKVLDGAQRARDPVAIRILQNAKVLPQELPPHLQFFASPVLFNWAGKEVGKVVVNL